MSTKVTRNPSLTPKRGFAAIGHEMKKNHLLFLMILPVILYVCLFNYAPMVGIILAFKKFNYTDGIFGSPWVGFKNFEYLVKGGVLWRTTRNTMLYNVAFMVLDMVSQMGVAIMLNEVRIKWFKKTSQSLMFLPHFISFVLVQSIAYAVFNYEYGMLNNMLRSIGAETVSIYTEPGYWPWILIFFHLWKGLGYGVVVYMAAITGISSEYYEAATLDGANKAQQIWYITMPLLKPIILVTAIMSTNGTLQLYDESVALTNGGPANASITMSHYIYNTTFVTSPNFGYAAAMSFLILIMVAVLSAIQMKVGDKR